MDKTDLFDDAAGETTTAPGEKKKRRDIVHIRNQQRNGRKSLTTIQGLAEDLDLVKILKVMRKMFSTNGTILKDEEMGEIIQLQGTRAEIIAQSDLCAERVLVLVPGLFG